MALRNLPAEAPLMLFTPFLTPAGSRSNSTPETPQRRDPFETFGRQLAKHHPNIQHVPYVAGIGFTDTHLKFMQESEAIITVVCEPNQSLKKGSMTKQCDFAEKALKAFVSRPTKCPSDGEFILVQCATDEARRQSQSAFANVIETDFYNDSAAAYLADSILGHD